MSEKVAVNPDGVPDTLRDHDSWVCWRTQCRDCWTIVPYGTETCPTDGCDSEPGKVPVDPNTGGLGSSTDSETWASFTDALEYHARDGTDTEGVGYVFDEDAVLAGADLDNVRDPETGEIEPWAQQVVDELDSFTEVSVSGTGLHVYAVGIKPGDKCRTDLPSTLDRFDDSEIEMYDSGRYFAFTGERLPDTPEDVEKRASAVRDVYDKHLADDTDDAQATVAEATPTDTADLEDGELVEKAKNAENGDAFERLWRGDTSGHAGDHSAARMALLSHLAFWTGKDARQMDRLFQESGLHPHPEKPGKWDRVGDDEIQKAINTVGEVYDPDSGGRSAPEAAADGGATAVGNGDSGPQSPDSPDGPGTDDSWESILQDYRDAEDTDEKLTARHSATQRLSDEHHWRNLRENDELYAYDEEAGIFRPDGESRVRDILVDELDEQYKAHELSEVQSQLRGRHTITNDELGGPDTMICCENCVLKITAGGIEQLDHDPEHNFIGRVQTEYDPEADCPRWEQFLDESLNDETTRKKLQEFAGYTLHHWGIPHHRALFLVGPTASGKSTFLDTIRTMLGNDAISSLTPQQMTSERFGGAELHGSWANIRNDIPTTLIENTGQFKEIVAGDPIKAEKKYQDPFLFEPTAKHMFSANQLPDADTDDRAFFRRILLAAFPNEVPEDERDKHLDSKLQAEHAGILNWALGGLQRLMNNGGFTGDRRPFETEDTWAKWGNSIERFAKVAIEDSNGSGLPTAEVFQAYLKFCDEEGIPAETNQQLVTKGIKSQGYQTGREYIDGSQCRAILGADWTGRGAELVDEGDDSGQQSGLNT